VVILSGFVAVVHSLRFMNLDHAVDDAWISFRIARNFVTHGVLSYDLGTPPVEGMTNLLWTGLSAVWIVLWPSLDPIVPARVLGVLLHGATAMLLATLAARVVGGKRAGRWAGGVVGVLIGAQGSMAFYAMYGLDSRVFRLMFVL